jgi:hypothetical protein
MRAQSPERTPLQHRLRAGAGRGEEGHPTTIEQAALTSRWGE